MSRFARDIALTLNVKQNTTRIEMLCIWASSLELTWGVLTLRMLVNNVREWVYARAKPQIARWVCQIWDKPLPPTIHSPGGGSVPQRTRPASSASSSNTTILTPPTTPDVALRPAIRRNSAQGKSAPGSLGGHRLPTTSSSGIQLNHEDSSSDTDSSVVYVKTVALPEKPRRLTKPRKSYPEQSRSGAEDEVEEVYFIDGQPNAPQKTKTRSNLAVDDIGKESRGKGRRCSSRF